jgi:hypothetical protein
MVSMSFCGNCQSQTRACNLGPCVTYACQLSQWSACPTCGSGSQTRTATCVSSNSQWSQNGQWTQNVVDASLCGGCQSQTQACNLAPCVTYQCAYGEWSTCPSCGQNTRTQIGQCVSSAGNVVSSNLCSNFNNNFNSCPSRSEACPVVACKRYVCTQGELGPCSNTQGEPITCGTGTQTRSAQKCTLIGEDGSFTEVDEMLCTQLSTGQPGCNSGASTSLQTSICQLAPCQTYVCVRQETPCYNSMGQSTNCGPAQRTRVSACSDSAGNQVAEYNCAAVGGCTALNGRLEDCNLPACGAVVTPVTPVTTTYTCTKGTGTPCRTTTGETCGANGVETGSSLVSYSCLNTAGVRVDAALCLTGTSSCAAKREECEVPDCKVVV